MLVNKYVQCSTLVRLFGNYFDYFYDWYKFSGRRY